MAKPVLALTKQFESGITKAIEKFLANPERDRHIEFVLKQMNIETAILIAVLSRDEFGKIHTHQRRIKKGILTKFSKILLSEKKGITMQSSFEELYKKIFSYKIKGIGTLAIYDITLRIAAYKNIAPKFIYLHAGTRKGLEKMTNSKIKIEKILISDLPNDFSKLTEYQIEIFLCHFYLYYD